MATVFIGGVPITFGDPITYDVPTKRRGKRTTAGDSANDPPQCDNCRHWKNCYCIKKEANTDNDYYCGKWQTG